MKHNNLSLSLQYHCHFFASKYPLHQIYITNRIMDHAGCVLWPLSKLLGRRFFKIMADRTLVSCIIYDNKLQINYMIARVLFANIRSVDNEHENKPWWFTSDDLPRGDPEIMFIPGDVIDSADGECSGTMYELSGQGLYNSELFDYFSGAVSSMINSGRLTILYEIATDDPSLVKIVKSRKETFDSVVLSFIHTWRLGHQVTLSNPSLLDIFSEIDVTPELMDTLAEYHTLLAKGNNSFPKLVPLSKAEIMRPYDICLKFWRECELLLISTDLCYMYLGTGMPLMSVTCPIYGMNKNKYRNNNIIRKYSMGEHIVSDIYEARRLVESGNDDQRLLKMASMNPDEYSVTDICGMIVMPYSGVSVSHVLTGAQGTIIRDSFLWSLRERLLNPLVFKQLFLNWLVTLMNLHIIGGIIHGDLHAGNVTMYTNYTGYEQKYIFADEESKMLDIYIQKSGEPYIGRIIDFSRSFITGHGPLTERHNSVSIETVVYDQRDRLLRSIERSIPEIYKAQKNRISDFIDTVEGRKKIGIIDEIYLCKALLGILDGLRSGMLDKRFLTSNVDDDSIKIEPMVIDESLIRLIKDYSDTAEQYLVKTIVSGESIEYPTITFVKNSGHFDDLVCRRVSISELGSLRVSEELDPKTFDTGACTENAGNRCISSTKSFGTTIREDIYMALIDAGDNFPTADKNKIRIMLDIHDRNEEWFTLSETWQEK